MTDKEMLSKISDRSLCILIKMVNSDLITIKDEYEKVIKDLESKRSMLEAEFQDRIIKAQQRGQTVQNIGDNKEKSRLE